MSILENFRTSYAQNREDVIIDAFFKDVKKGFYVDVGANDPEDDSVTKIFYDKGWHGINIEPNGVLYEKLVAARKRDVNLNVGISDTKGVLVLREYNNHGLSTFEKDIQQSYMESDNEKTSSYIDTNVYVKPLRVVFREQRVKKIHFMKVDVEGYEYQVLAGNDWDKYRPELLCIEANHIKEDWRPLLKKASYELVFFDGLNEYYLTKEALHRKDQFDYAESIVLGKQIVSPGVAKLISGSGGSTIVDNLEREVSTLKESYNGVVSQRNMLYSQLQQYQGVKAQIKALIFSLNQALLGRAEAINKPSIVKKPGDIGGDLLKKDTGELLRMSLAYDKKALTESRLIGGARRRVMSRLVALAIKAGFKTIDLVLRLLYKIARKIG